MPSVSERQAKFMRAAAHNPKIAKAHGISQKTAMEFVRADQSKNSEFQSKKKVKQKVSK